MVGKRVVRFEEKAVGKAKRKAVTARKPEQLLVDLATPNLEAAVKGLSEKELEALIDFGTVADEERNALDGQVKLIKAALLVRAKKAKWKTRAGAVGVAKVSPRTSTSILPRKMVALLSKLKKQKLFDTVFNVKVGEAKKYLGEDVLEPIAQIQTKEFGSISLKRLEKSRS